MFYGILLALCLPLTQQVFKWAEVKPLSGAYNLPDTVPLTAKNWFSGRFQDLYSPYYEYEIGFRPSFVRLRNQLIFYTYDKSTTYVVLGKENQLFAYNYWETMQDFSFIGRDSIMDEVESIVKLKQKLDSLGVPMLVVVGANKVRYMPEYLPEDLRGKGNPSNYDVYVPALQQAGVSVVDFNAIFQQMKPQVGKKMFPNTGTHWSDYGMVMCLDSILKFTGHYHKEVKQLNLKGYMEKDSVLPSDLDLSNDLNLMIPIPREKNLFAKCNVDSTGRKARLFIIGDSFFWNLYQLDEFYKTVDSTSHFWYYNNSEIKFTGEHIPLDNMDPVKIAHESDAVIILATEANLHLLPYGFPNDFLKKLKKE